MEIQYIDWKLKEASHKVDQKDTFMGNRRKKDKKIRGSGLEFQHINKKSPCKREKRNKRKRMRK